ncbi:MAG: dihydrofolate reductase [Prevotellaceae bacterium]|jgi:dihydrofolate reductase|nr:dihydrofolate reductase [Prevotellaceae bacterium]
MLSIIVAVAENNVIGCNNQLIWHISEDLKYFKRITSGHAVIMGRKTFESIGKPLPHRTNIVISKNAELKPEGATVVPSLEDAIAKVNPQEENFIIGGGSIYREAMCLADKLYLTKIHHTYEGDTFFPEIGNEWKEISREDFEHGEKFGHPFSFITYERKKHG